MPVMPIGSNDALVEGQAHTDLHVGQRSSSQQQHVSEEKDSDNGDNLVGSNVHEGEKRDQIPSTVNGELGCGPLASDGVSAQSNGEKSYVQEASSTNGIRPKPLPVAEAVAKEELAGQVQSSQLSRTMAPGKWRLMVAMIAIFVFLNGYDISNTANIQASIYESFGHIEIFSWITLGYCVGIATLMPLVRRLAEIFDFRPMLLASTIFFMIGAAITASAKSLGGVIVGRVLNGFGASGMTYLVVGYVAFFSKPSEVARVQGLIGVMLSIGLMAGPLVGTGFASNQHATWRWAFYLVLPILGLCLVPIWLVFPSYTVPRRPGVTLLHQIWNIDWVGAVLHMATITLLALALTLSGSKYEWNSGSAVALWVLAGICLFSYVSQQFFCILTTPQRRIFPGHLLKNHTVAFANLGSFCAAIAYSVGLYYFPVFFAFARGHSPVESAVRFLPFIGVFIAGTLISGGLLPVIGRYKIMYMIGGPIILTAGALITTQMDPSISETAVMGFEALLGFGVGMVFSYSMPISTAVLPPEEYFAAACLSNLSTLGTISISLSIAGSVFQNMGHKLLREAGFNDNDIELALGGVASPAWKNSDSATQEQAVSAVTWAINTVFYLVLASGTICTIASLAMKWEKLDFRKVKAETRTGVAVDIGSDSHEMTAGNVSG